jgi:hypothetical protein
MKLVVKQSSFCLDEAQDIFQAIGKYAVLLALDNYQRLGHHRRRYVAMPYGGALYLACLSPWTDPLPTKPGDGA